MVQRLAARELYDHTLEMFQAFISTPEDAISWATIEAQYVALVVMTRAIGHVLRNVDGDEAAWETAIKQRLALNATHPTFKDYLKPTRDKLLKQYRSRILLPESARLNTAAVVNSLGQPELRVFVRVATLTDEEGRNVIAALKAALDFWNSELHAIERALALPR
jgi:hypothetical protein